MKRVLLILMIAVVTVTAACDKFKGDPTPIQKINQSKSDTSTSLIANTSIVGDWVVVTDSISNMSLNQDTTYHGTIADVYHFTKYGNLFAKSAFHGVIDTGVYTISTENKVQWINSFAQSDGATFGPGTTIGAFSITSVSQHSLVLTQHAISPGGELYHEITFKK